MKSSFQCVDIINVLFVIHRFILCQVDCDVYHSLDAGSDDDSAIEARESEERKKREWLSEVDFNK